MNELKRCPFCGGEAEIWDGYIEEFLKTEYMKYVQCNYCKASTKLYFTEKKAIKAWNTRKPMERILERLEKHLALEDDLYDEMSSGARSAYSHAIKIVKMESGIE